MPSRPRVRCGTKPRTGSDAARLDKAWPAHALWGVVKNLMGLMVPVVALCIATAGLSPASELYSDKIVAVVNGDPILESDIKKQKQPLMRNFMNLPLGVVPPGKWPTEREILDELVIIRLLEQEAARKGVKVDDRNVDASIESIKKRNKLQKDQFTMFLAANGLSVQDYRAIIKRQFLLTRLISGEVTQKTPMSEEDLIAYFKKNKDKINEEYAKLVTATAPAAQNEEKKPPEIPTHEEIFTGGKLRLRQITLMIPKDTKNRDAEKIYEKGKQIFREAMSGAEFAQLAKRHSQDPNASHGGDLGIMLYKDMVPGFQKLVQRMKEGDITPPIKTPQAVLIFYLEDAKGRQSQRVAIPEKIRKEMEKQWKEAYERRDAEKRKQEERAEPEEEDPKEKPKIPAGLLSADEEKEYLKVRRKVGEILRRQRIENRMKDWIDNLKKNSIVEIKL